MTQEEFNAMLQVALASGLTGYATLKYSAEEIEKLLDKVAALPENGG